MLPNFTARYGVFDADMNPHATLDVAEKVNHFIKDGFLILPKEQPLDELFPNEFQGTKFLQIRLADGRKINILNDAYAFDVCVNLLSNEKLIVIVYYIYIKPESDWKVLIGGQLSDLKSYGLLDEAELYIHISNEHQTAGVLDFVKTAAGPNAVISQSFTNQFEYPGIKLLYDLATKYPHKTFMYFHTKGMSYNLIKRSDDEQVLLSGTFKNWRKNLEAFQDPAINKLGMFPARHDEIGGGWLWFNFFIARGSYLAGCDNPIIAVRHYYEFWISRYKGNIIVDDCYSLHTHKRENFYQVETVKYMDQCIQAAGGKKKKIYKLNIPWVKKKKLAFKKYMKRFVK